MQVHLTTLIGGSFIKVLPHMLAHYRELGLSSFLVNAHLSHPADPVLEEIKEATTNFGCALASVNVGGWPAAQAEICSRTMRKHPDDWFVLADQDELQVYPGDVFEIIEMCKSRGYDYITGCFVDRISADGSFPDVAQDRSIWSQFPLGGFVTYPMLGADPRKVVAASGRVFVSRGQHEAFNGMGCPIETIYVQVHHFKWVKGLVDRLTQRAKDYKQLNTSWFGNQRFVEYFEQHGGKIDIKEPKFRIVECDRDYGHWEDIRQMAIAFKNKKIMPS